MEVSMRRRDFLTTTAAALTLPFSRAVRGAALAAPRRLLYVAEPGIRNYVQYGGVGIVVYDIDAGYKFVKRIPTWNVPAGEEPDNVKGVAAHAGTHRIFVSTIKRLMAIDLVGEKPIWDVAPEAGCDRLAVSPDGRLLYVPSFEGPHWNVIDAATGNTITKIVLNSGAHNTIYAPDGSRVYLAGRRSTTLSIADPKTHKVVSTVGPFVGNIRPFTIDGSQRRVYVNCDGLLGFEIGDITTGKVLHHVEISGVEKGPVERHGCPSHGIGLTPDEREVWVCDGHNRLLHVFDNTVMPPKQIASLKVRDLPGWISFSQDGKHAWPSTGEVFDVQTKKLVIALKDETGRELGSEKQVELLVDGTTILRAADQFGVGMKK
jgi:YVTN family beta-propeller protein